MKLLVINPNISHSVTALIAAEARRAASPGTEIVPVPLVDGVSSGVRLAEARVRAGAGAGEPAGYLPPPEKPHKGLSPALAALVGRRVVE